MVQYIDKSALIAEIEKRLNYRNKGLEAINNGTFWDEEQSEDTFNEALTICAYNAVKNELFELKCFLDIVETIEVKEVENTELLNVKGYLVRDKDDYTAIVGSDIGKEEKIWKRKKEKTSGTLKEKTLGTLEPYQYRMVEEYMQLDMRVNSLAQFIGSSEFEKLPDEERKDMTIQLNAMMIYRASLTNRLGRNELIGIRLL